MPAPLLLTVLLHLSYAAGAEPLPQAPSDTVVEWARPVIEQEAMRLCLETGPASRLNASVPFSISDPLDVAATVSAINLSGYGVRFRVLEVGNRTLVVPYERSNADGSWSSHSPVLDTELDFGAEARDTADVLLDRWIETLAATLGEPVHFNGFLQPYGTCSLPATGKARDLLITIMDCRGPDDVWVMGSGAGGHSLSIIHQWRWSADPTDGMTPSEKTAWYWAELDRKNADALPVRPGPVPEQPGAE